MAKKGTMKSKKPPTPDAGVFAVGDLVECSWWGSLIEGTVEEIFHAPVTRTIKGKAIKRNGSPETPACLVRSEAGNLALKLATELRPRRKIFKSET